MSGVQFFLFRFRFPIILVVLTFVLYVNFFMWFFTPFTFHAYSWRPDSKAVITTVLENSPADPYLELEDKLLEVDDRPVRRMQLVYPLPLKSVYQFTVLREGSVQDVDVPVATQPNSLGVSYRLPSGIISLAGWFMGTIILWFAKRENRQALFVGSIFLLAATTIMGIQGALFGVPGAWIGGHPLVFILSVGWLYLGIVPYTEPLNPRLSSLLKFLSFFGR